MTDSGTWRAVGEAMVEGIRAGLDAADDRWLWERPPPPCQSRRGHGPHTRCEECITMGELARLLAEHDAQKALGDQFGVAGDDVRAALERSS